MDIREAGPIAAQIVGHQMNMVQIPERLSYIDGQLTDEWSEREGVRERERGIPRGMILTGQVHRPHSLPEDETWPPVLLRLASDAYD